MLVHCVCITYTKYSVLMNVSSACTLSICMYATSTRKSSLKIGNLAEIFLEIRKTCNGNPKILHEILNSPRNLKIFPEIRKSSAKSQDFGITYRIFYSDINPSVQRMRSKFSLIYCANERNRSTLNVWEALKE